MLILNINKLSGNKGRIKPSQINAFLSPRHLIIIFTLKLSGKAMREGHVVGGSKKRAQLLSGQIL